MAIADAAPDIDAMDDLGPLAWIIDELTKSLTQAQKALRLYLREQLNLDHAASGQAAHPDVAPLNDARHHLHQSVGALELVDLPAAAALLRAVDGAVQRFAEEPGRLDGNAVDAIDRACFALVDFLQLKLAGKSVASAALFPQYREVAELAGLDRVHPADLWDSPWQWCDPAVPLPDAPTAGTLASQARARFDSALLGLLRGHAEAGAALRDLCLALAAVARVPERRIFWKIAAGFFDGVGRGLIRMDLYVKRAAGRVLTQYTAFERGEADASALLARDLAFFCVAAGAPGTPSAVGAFEAVRAAYGAAQAGAVDYDRPLYGRFDPALLKVARTRVSAAKAAWSALCGGEPVKSDAVVAAFAAVGESLRQLVPGSERFAGVLQRAVETEARGSRIPAAEPAMEIATAALYVEAVFADMDLDDPQLGSRLEQLAGRIAAVEQGGKSQALEPWIEELYRRVNDRRTIGNVVGELRGALGRLEELLDAFFRRPDDASGVPEALTLLQRMRGVLSVLGLDEASRATHAMEEQVGQLAAPESGGAGREAITAALGRSLGALGFMIDMLNYQPALARKLFVFDKAQRELRPLMGRKAAPEVPAAQPAAEALALLATPAEGALDDQVTSDMSLVLGRLAEQAEISDQPSLAAKAKEAVQALAEAKSSAQRAEVVARIADTISEPAAKPPEAAPAVRGATMAEDDLRDVFLEEARDVVASGEEGLRQLAAASDDAAALAQVRRAFHTLKGSSRMVGLADFGEAAWACEQCCNAWIASSAPVTPEFAAFAGNALQHFGQWVDDLAAHRDGQHAVAGFQQAAAAVQLPGAAAPDDAPTAAAPLPAMAEPPARQEPAEAAPEEEEAPADWSQPTMPMDMAPVAEPESPAVRDLSSLDLPSLDLGGSAEDATGPAAGEDALPMPDESVETQPTQPALLDTRPAALDKRPGRGTAAPVRTIGTFEINEALYNVYLGEADTWSTELEHALQAWATDHRPEALGQAETRAHSLAGSSATVGFAALSGFARLLEHAIGHLRQSGLPPDAAWPPECAVLPRAAAEIRALLHQFAAGFLKEPSAELAAQLEAFESVDLHPAHLAGLEVAEPAQPEEHATDAAPAADGHGKPWPETEAAPLLPERVAPVPAAVSAPDASPPAVAAPAAEPDLHGIDPAEAAIVGSELFGFFREEAADLIPTVAKGLRQWAAKSGDESSNPLLPVLRGLHTLKGSARLAGAMRLGDMAHALESALQHVDQAAPTRVQIDDALDRFDRIETEFDALCAVADEANTPEGALALATGMPVPASIAAAPIVSAPVAPAAQAPAPTAPAAKGTAAVITEKPVPVAAKPVEETAVPAQEDAVVPPDVGAAGRDDRSAASSGAASSDEPIASASAGESQPGEAPATAGNENAPREPETASALLSQEKAAAEPQAPAPAAEATTEALQQAEARLAGLATAAARRRTEPASGGGGTALLRVRSGLIDELVRGAGEVAMSRSLIEGEVQQIKAMQRDLAENLERLRTQLRELELQAETQMTSRMDAARAEGHEFDPLEFDRYTRIQELTRMLAESVNDVATLQRTLQRASSAAEDELVAQGRTARELQRGLLHTRMVAFDSIAERFYRVVRQAARECGKRAELQVTGGDIEIDRAVLERMAPAFEHMLRNCVVHGIELPEQRLRAGKPEIGRIVVTLRQEGNDVSIAITDDGAGLDLPRIRARAEVMHLVSPGVELTDHDIAQLIYAPGLSTTDEVTELAGRGVGMDVAHAQVLALGGHIEVAQTSPAGTRFELVLPLTTAVTQIALLRVGGQTIGVPVNLVENVQRFDAEARAAVVRDNALPYRDTRLAAYALGALLDLPRSASEDGEVPQWLVLRSAGQRIALVVDEVLGNQEVVVRNIGPQFSRLPGIAGLTVLAGGRIVLIYNPVVLAQVYGASLRIADVLGTGASAQPEAPAKPVEPLVLVVDDSLTVRRVTQRLLERAGGVRVALAKDGEDALEKVAAERPALILSDIEMPRMDGFEFVRRLRDDNVLRDVPVVMITSRIAQKHRDYAQELGVSHYLGKPYAEDELLALVRQYTGTHEAAGH